MKILLGLLASFTFILSLMMGFLVGYEYQKAQKAEVQTHIVSVMLHNPPAKKKPSIPKLFENQEHQMEVEAIEESSQLYCMAQTIYFEASNQSREGKEAVARVVMNRVKSLSWPNTICDVVKQKMQFSWYWDKKHDVPNKKSKAWKDSLEVATDFVYGSVAQDNELDAALHYHADYVNPSWARKKIMIAKIDDHIFYGR